MAFLCLRRCFGALFFGGHILTPPYANLVITLVYLMLFFMEKTVLQQCNVRYLMARKTSTFIGQIAMFSCLSVTIHDSGMYSSNSAFWDQILV